MARDPGRPSHALVAPHPQAAQAPAGPPRSDPDDDLFGPLPDVEPIPRPPNRPRRVAVYDVQSKSRAGGAEVPALTSSAVARTIEAHHDAFAACNEEARRRVPDLEGLVLLRFVIGADGSVSRLRDVSARVPDEAARDCLMKAVGALRFAKPERGEDVHVQLALYFEE